MDNFCPTFRKSQQIVTIKHSVGPAICSQRGIHHLEGRGQQMLDVSDRDLNGLNKFSAINCLTMQLTSATKGDQNLKTSDSIGGLCL